MEAMSVTLVGELHEDRLGELVPCLPVLGGDGDRKGVLISSSRPIELLKLLPQNVVIRFIFTKLPSG